MGEDTQDLMDLLSTTSEDRLESFVRRKIDGRLSELKERQKRLNEELAAVNHELQQLQQYSSGGKEAPTPQEVLVKLLKGK